MKRMEHPSRDKRLREVGLVSLEKRRLGGNLIYVYKYLKRRCKENRTRLLSVVPSDRTRGNGHKLKHSKCPPNIRERLIIVRVNKHWPRLHRDVVESPSLEIFRRCAD